MIKIHIMHTGQVRVSPNLPLGGVNCSLLKASGLFMSKKKKIWIPVSSYLIELDGKKVLFDTGWARDMSPLGEYDKKAQIRSLGSRLLYWVNQGQVPPGQAVDEQLAKIGVLPEDIDYVLMSHLDCDHADGLNGVADAKNILVSRPELDGVHKNPMRFHRKWWKEVGLKTFDWNGSEGPFGKSFDVLGDESLTMVWIPGHSEGLCALKIKSPDGRFVILCADGAYCERNWKEMIPSGIAVNRSQQMRSLKWIKDESLKDECVGIFATHDPAVRPQTIEL